MTIKNYSVSIFKCSPLFSTWSTYIFLNKRFTMKSSTNLCTMWFATTVVLDIPLWFVFENIYTQTHASVYRGMLIQVKREHIVYDVISDIWYLRYVSLPRSFDAYIYTCVERFFSFIYTQQSCFSVLLHLRGVYFLDLYVNFVRMVCIFFSPNILSFFSRFLPLTLFPFSFFILSAFC
jgi:hypothetical protein